MEVNIILKNKNEILLEELKRLKRLNDTLEVLIMNQKIIDRPEQKILENVLAMCEIAKLF